MVAGVVRLHPALLNQLTPVIPPELRAMCEGGSLPPSVPHQNNTHMKRYFVDYGDYNRTQNASEIFIRYEQDGELFDVCQMSDECGDPVSIAEYMCSCLSVPQMG